MTHVGFEPTTLCIPDRCSTTKVAQLGGPKSNISYACINRLTYHLALGEGRGNETTKDTNTKPKHIHDVTGFVERKKDTRGDVHMRRGPPFHM